MIYLWRYVPEKFLHIIIKNTAAGMDSLLCSGYPAGYCCAPVPRPAGFKGYTHLL